MNDLSVRLFQKSRTKPGETNKNQRCGSHLTEIGKF